MRNKLTDVVIDIETVRLPVPVSSLAKLEKEWARKAVEHENEWLPEKYAEAYKKPKNYKDPAKLVAHFDAYMQGYPEKKAEADAKFEEKKADAFQAFDDKTAFRLDRNDMISVAVGQVYGNDIQDVECYYDETPAELAKKVAAYVDAVGPFRFIGYNLENYDLPILLKHMAQAGATTKHKIGKWDTCDLCRKPFDRSIPLKDAARAFGLKTLDLDGSDVAELYEKRDWQTIAKYNVMDVKLTGKLYVLASALFEL